MSESGDYTPAPWAQGHNFTQAKIDYTQTVVDRSYDNAVEAGVTLGDIIAPSISTDAEAPVVVMSDETGSMGEWPAVMFSKLPYLDHELKYYLGEKAQICFGAFGDTRPGRERYPLQAKGFAAGAELKEHLDNLIIEKNGGGQMHESSHLAMLYFARNCQMPKAIRKPIFILITDEMPWEEAETNETKTVAHVNLKRPLSVADIVSELATKFSIWIVLKPYGDHTNVTDGMDADTEEIYRTWVKLVGNKRVKLLPDPNRVVDVIFGIFAIESNRVADFQKEIEGRQTKAQVKTVLTALRLDQHQLNKAPARKQLKGVSRLHGVKPDEDDTESLV